jgi:hypothetical protein
VTVGTEMVESKEAFFFIEQCTAAHQNAEVFDATMEEFDSRSVKRRDVDEGGN